MTFDSIVITRQAFAARRRDLLEAFGAYPSSYWADRVMQCNDAELEFTELLRKEGK